MSDPIASDNTTLTHRDALDEQVRQAIGNNKARNTKRAYAADWAHFEAWCEEQNEVSKPAGPATVARYLVAHASKLKRSTLERRLTGITAAHRYAGHESPSHSFLVKETMKGIRRQKAEAGEEPRQVDAAVTAIVRQFVETLDEDTMRGKRDRLLILLGFAGAFRRSELVALRVQDIQETHEGLVVKMRRSKTDQEGKGMLKGIPYGLHIDTCPVHAYKAWLESSGITEGAIFRPINKHGHIGPKSLSSDSVTDIIKGAAERVGLDPKRFAGQSLRSGLATAAAEAGVPEMEIMAQGGWKSQAGCQRYIRRGSLFNRNAASKVGL